jgi:hypothetical protein
MEEEREFDVQSVEDAMRPATGASLSGASSLGSSIARLSDLTADYFLIELGGGRWGGISRPQLVALGTTGPHDSPLASFVAPIERPYLYPDQSLETALRALKGRPFVPVVHRADPQRLEGVLALDDVLRAVAGAERIGYTHES